MAIYKEDIVSIELSNGAIHRSFLNHSIGTGDNSANRFGIRVFRNGSEVDLSGASCQAYFQNAEGTNIALTSYGTVSGNVAYVTLPQACYNVEGQFCLAIKLIGGGVTGTMRIIDGMVCNTGTTGAVAPTSSVPTYQEILSVYADMVAATSAANLAIAEEFDASKNYPAGKNVINDGALYFLPNGHTAGTTWANTTKVASNLGDQVTDLKSALDTKQDGEHLVNRSQSMFARKTGNDNSGQAVWVDSNTRIITYPPIAIAKGDGAEIAITPTTGYKYILYQLNNGNYVAPFGNYAWSSEASVIKLDKSTDQIVLNISKSDNSTITTDDYNKVSCVYKSGLLSEIDTISEETDNKFDGVFSAFGSTKYENGAIVNTNTETRTFLRMQVLFRNGSTMVTGTNLRDISENGRQSFTVTPSGNGDNIFIKHNGSTRDISFTIPFNFVASQPYTVSFMVEGHDPATIGGIVLSQIQIELGSTATPYAPYFTANDYIARNTLLGKTDNTLISKFKNIRFFSDFEGVTVEEDTTNSKLYFKVDNIYIRGISGHNRTVTKAQLAEELGLTLVTSPKGVVNCIELSGSVSIVFNLSSYTFVLRSIQNVLYDEVLVIVSSNGHLAYINQNLLNAGMVWNDYQNHINPKNLKYYTTQIGKMRSVLYKSDAKFLFFSDIHGSSSNMRRIADFAKLAGATFLDAVINGGDTVQNVLDDGVTWYNSYVDTIPVDVLTCIGNHDAWSTTPGTPATKTAIYNAEIAPVVSKVSNIVQPSDASANSLCYYYKDYENVRVIVLDAMSGDNGIAHYDSAQDTWFRSVLADAVTNSKTVVCVAHAPFDKASETLVRDDENTWNSWKSYSALDAIHIDNGALTAVDTFISNGGKFVCWLTGHTHFDNVLTDAAHPGQFMINIATANYYNHNIDGMNLYNEATGLYDCMNYIGIDTTNKMLKCMRIGYNLDGGLKQRNFLSYNYDLHKIITST